MPKNIVFDSKIRQKSTNLVGSKMEKKREKVSSG